MITRTGSHALRALAALGRFPTGRYVGAGEIARLVKAPSNYLGKLFRQLSRAGVVESRKGTNGGFRLLRAPQAISLFDILDPIEHVSRVNGCVLGRPRCTGACPVHRGWAHARDAYLEFLRTTTLADLSRDRPSVFRQKGGQKERAADTAPGGVQ